MRLHKTSIIAILPLIAGCSTLRNPEAVNYDVSTLAPEQWADIKENTPVQTNWINTFGDEDLNTLVSEALEANFALEAADYQTQAAQTAIRITNSMRLPKLNASLNSGRQQTISRLTNFEKQEFDQHSLTFGAQWEIDVWNRIGNQRDAAVSQYEATVLDYQAFELSLAAQVARAWYNSILFQAQLQLASDTTQSLESNLKVLENRYDKGLITSFDLRLARAQTATARSVEQRQKNTLDNTIRQLEILLGRYPSGKLALREDIPTIAERIPAGLPAELVKRRPDIAATEQRLKASISQDAATQANWLPSISLTGSAGTTSDEFSNLLDTDFSIWSIFGNVTAPLFQFGKLKSERLQSEALLNAQVAQYKNSVLGAFAEVESGLANEKNLKTLISDLEISARESTLAEEQSWKLYERGLINITSVLDTQRRSFDARSQLITARNNLVQNRINLHLALGGGFTQD